MTILLYGFGVLFAVSAIVTVYATLTAPDGYEDETGFHPIGTSRSPVAVADKKSVGSNLPPFAPAS